MFVTMAEKYEKDHNEEQPLTTEALLKEILEQSRVISEGIEDISKTAYSASTNAGKYVENIEKTAVGLRKETCAHLRSLVDDMQKAVKIEL